MIARTSLKGQPGMSDNAHVEDAVEDGWEYEDDGLGSLNDIEFVDETEDVDVGVEKIANVDEDVSPKDVMIDPFDSKTIDKSNGALVNVGNGSHGTDPSSSSFVYGRIVPGSFWQRIVAVAAPQFPPQEYQNPQASSFSSPSLNEPEKSISILPNPVVLENANQISKQTPAYRSQACNQQGLPPCLNGTVEFEQDINDNEWNQDDSFIDKIADDAFVPEEEIIFSRETFDDSIVKEIATSTSSAPTSVVVSFENENENENGRSEKSSSASFIVPAGHSSESKSSIVPVALPLQRPTEQHWQLLNAPDGSKRCEEAANSPEIIVSELKNEISTIKKERDFMEEEVLECYQTIETLKGLLEHSQTKSLTTISSLHDKHVLSQKLIDTKEQECGALKDQISKSLVANETIIQLREAIVDLERRLHEKEMALSVMKLKESKSLEIASTDVDSTDDKNKLQVVTSTTTRCQQASGEGSEPAGTLSLVHNAELVAALQDELAGKNAEIQYLQGLLDGSKDNKYSYKQSPENTEPSYSSETEKSAPDLIQYLYQQLSEKQKQLDSASNRLEDLSNQNILLVDKVQLLEGLCDDLKSKSKNAEKAARIVDEKAKQQRGHVILQTEQTGSEQVEREPSNHLIMTEKTPSVSFKINEMTMALAEKTVQVDNLYERCNDLDQANACLMHKLQESEALMAEVSARENARIEQMRRKLEQSNSVCKTCEYERDEALSRAAHLEEQIDMIEEQANRKIKDTETTILRLHNEIDEWSTRMRTTEAQFDDLQNLYNKSIAQLDQEREHVQHLLQLTNQKHQANQDSSLVAIAEYERVCLENAKYCEDKRRYLDEIADCRQQLASTTETYEATINRLRTDLGIANNHKDKNGEDTTEEILLLRNTCDKLKAENEELYVQFASWNSEFEGVKEQLTIAEAQLLVAQNQTNQTSDDSEIVSKENASLKLQVEKLTRLNADLTGVAETLAGEREKLQSQLDATIDEGTNPLQDLCKSQREEIALLQKQIRKLQASESSSRNKNNEAIDKLEVTCKQFQDELIKTRTSNDEWMKKANELETQILSLSEQIQRINDELLRTKTELFSKEQACEKLDSELQVAKSENENYRELVEQERQRKAKAAGNVGTERDVESLRGYIITLATALEQSECQRAEAVERLAEERESNAATVRRLNDAVKKFYSTVSMGE